MFSAAPVAVVVRVYEHIMCLHFEQTCLINDVTETQRQEVGVNMAAGTGT